MEVIHMRLKERIKYWKDIRNGTSIPLFWCNANKNNFNQKNSCNVFYHPCVNNLAKKQRDLINYHIGSAIDIIRTNIEREEL